MVHAKCGFDGAPGTDGAQLLVNVGPTILVNIGFDPNWKPVPPGPIPVAGITDVQALVDTGAAESCIDSLLAAQLGLPIADNKPISGVHGSQRVNLHLAQIHIPSLSNTIYGLFAGVHLAAGGQVHRAILGRTFLRNFVMVYSGTSGSVTLTRP
jgi:hypothetical protein